ncbi:MAG: NYN domain-containing protein, partial [Chloroflexota bacterium]|nr:NYN domain-containing protein [Chloroflexota bacterium]
STHGRVALFIDGTNFYHTIRDLDMHVDYRRLLEHFTAGDSLVRAIYYTTLLEDGKAPDWLTRLLEWLSYNGYHVVTKPAKHVRRRIVGEDGESYWVEEVKGDLDVEMTVDIFGLTPYCDTIFLFSGDGSFVYLIKAVQRRGCRVVVVSSEKTKESSVADEMRRQADEFIDLVTIADEIRWLDDGSD